MIRSEYILSDLQRSQQEWLRLFEPILTQKKPSQVIEAEADVRMVVAQRLPAHGQRFAEQRLSLIVATLPGVHFAKQTPQVQRIDPPVGRFALEVQRDFLQVLLVCQAASVLLQ